MTIEQVADRLKKCASCKNPNTCEFYNVGDSLKVCTNRLIRKMGNECEKIGSKMNREEQE